MRRFRPLPIASLMVLLALWAQPGRARASTTQEAMMQDDTLVVAAPGQVLQEMRDIGVGRVRLSLRWATVAPRPTAERPPRRFVATDPADYPARKWAVYDTAITTAAHLGIGIDLDLVGAVPSWAQGPDKPASSLNGVWEPSAARYRQFVIAAGVRYSGNWDPVTRRLDPGNPDDLPRVDFWSVWNEPDYGPSLAPQGLPGDLTVPHAPEMYRKLVDAGWSGLRASGHLGDTFLFGEVAPRGSARWGVFSGMKPLFFLRSMYCLDGSYRPLRGRLARLEGCPRTAAGSARFRAQNPALFDATGFSDHPYSRNNPPDVEPGNDPDYSSLADLGQLENALDAVNRAYGSPTVFPIWDTEYGYITSPPKITPDPHNKQEMYATPAVAAADMNEAEYISWRDPRIQSYMQYLLQDPLKPTAANDFGGFASGLIAHDGTPKPTYAAWVMPVWLPRTTVTAGTPIEVWGAVRPVHEALIDDPYDDETAEIQFEPSGGSTFTTVAEQPVTDANGYFDTDVVFPGSGTVRIQWTYPANDPGLEPGTVVDSRQVQITVR